MSLAVAIPIFMFLAAPSALAAPSPGSSGSSVYGWTGDDGIDLIGVGETGGQSGGQGSGNGQEPPAGYTRRISCDGTEPADLTAACVLVTQRCAPAGSVASNREPSFVQDFTDDKGSWIIRGTTCNSIAPPPTAAAVTPAMVLDQARREVPSVTIGATPQATALVNLEVLLWVNTTPTRTLPIATILGQPVTITIHAQSVSWDFGDGHTATTTGLGTPYTPADDCTTTQCPGFFGHTYTSTGAGSTAREGESQREPSRRWRLTEPQSVASAPIPLGGDRR